MNPFDHRTTWTQFNWFVSSLSLLKCQTINIPIETFIPYLQADLMQWEIFHQIIYFQYFISSYFFLLIFFKISHFILIFPFYIIIIIVESYSKNFCFKTFQIALLNKKILNNQWIDEGKVPEESLHLWRYSQFSAIYLLRNYV
jgi:hypothetical protein